MTDTDKAPQYVDQRQYADLPHIKIVVKKLLYESTTFEVEAEVSDFDSTILIDLLDKSLGRVLSLLDESQKSNPKPG